MGAAGAAHLLAHAGHEHPDQDTAEMTARRARLLKALGTG